MAHQLQTSLLFDEADAEIRGPDVTYVESFTEHHQEWFDALIENLHWNSQYKSRLTHTFGVSYNYKKGTKKVREMPHFLEPVCERIEKKFGYLPNNCLANYYPSGEHYISLHSDQDDEMKAQTGVTIVSLGSVRTMELRNISNPKLRFFYPLQPGSAFYMEDELQKEWKHGIPREAEAGPRISLSFRALIA